MKAVCGKVFVLSSFWAKCCGSEGFTEVKGHSNNPLCYSSHRSALCCALVTVFAHQLCVLDLWFPSSSSDGFIPAAVTGWLKAAWWQWGQCIVGLCEVCGDWVRLTTLHHGVMFSAAQFWLKQLSCFSCVTLEEVTPVTVKPWSQQTKNTFSFLMTWVLLLLVKIIFSLWLFLITLTLLVDGGQWPQ